MIFPKTRPITCYICEGTGDDLTCPPSAVVDHAGDFVTKRCGSCKGSGTLAIKLSLTERIDRIENWIIAHKTYHPM